MRRSVMARPNLSVRGSTWLLLAISGKGETGGEQPRRSFPFQAREARAFPPTPSGDVARAPLSLHSGQTPSRVSLPRHRSRGIPDGHGGRKLNSIIDAERGQQDHVCLETSAESLSYVRIIRPLRQSLLNRLFRQWRHDRVSSFVRMQPVLRQITLEEAFVVN